MTATATLFQQLEKPFPAALVPLASAGERDFIYSKSDIVYISTSAILSMRKRHNLLLHQFHLQQASAGERDFIYRKSDIVYISTSAILSMRKRHNLLLHEFHLQQEQHILQQQLELPITERAKCTFNNKSIAIYSSS